MKNILLFYCCLAQFACVSQRHLSKIEVGAEQISEFLPQILHKNIALVVNQTSVIHKTHLVDSLLSLGVNIKTIFAPEHGFRGTAADGEHVSNGIDTKTKLPILSLYGNNKKPNKVQLADIQIIIFDIQDVGARFYTFISTMQYVMEACAENGIQLIILDRPNPNGNYIDGPTLNPKFKSFVGMAPIPVVHGCTIGELALMINGEGWLQSKPNRCNLSIIKCKNYKHDSVFAPPIKPSPNLPNMQAIKLYPSLCLFEGTNISVGRGTDTQFQVIGAPNAAYGSYVFIPEDKPGTNNPPQKGKTCYGLDLRKIDAQKIGFSLKYLLDFYQKTPEKTSFFNANFFDKLAGTDSLRKQIMAGWQEPAIRKTWQADLKKYKSIRNEYLCYD